MVWCQGILGDLGFVYFRMQRYREAETTLRHRDRHCREGWLRGDYFTGGFTRLPHGRVYTEQHNFAEAESCLKRRASS